ncbi:MAG: DJ-1/PfpI family protein [Pseudomonadota bacterium]
MAHKVLIVTTSTGRAGEDGPETGFDWISIAAPYWRLREAGVRVGFASIRGGKPPGDPATAVDAETGGRAGSVNMFLGDGTAVDALAQSTAVDRIDPSQWDAVLIADGFGGLWDLAPSDALAALIAALWERGGLVAAIGAGAAALPGVRDKDGRTLVLGKRLTCLPDAAATAAGIVPPVLPEALLRHKGAQVWVSGDGEDTGVIEEGRLITAQNARAAADLALQLLDALDANIARAGADAATPGGAGLTDAAAAVPRDGD